MNKKDKQLVDLLDQLDVVIEDWLLIDEDSPVKWDSVKKARQRCGAAGGMRSYIAGAANKLRNYMWDTK